MCRSTLLLVLVGIFMVLDTTVLSAQNNVLKGVIKDEEGVPVIGASILEQGTRNGAFSDLDGKFSLTLAGKVGETQIKITSIGFQDQVIKVMNLKSLDIILGTSATMLDDVVVVGYGTQKKESVVGAISSTKGEELAKAGGVTNISRALGGLVPGLVTINTSGKPGASEADILIRGKSTWNDAAPLVLVDDVERDMNNIDPEEVESISVLKDASATAIFGVRGANGVILITTKRGREGKPTIRFSAMGTMKTVSKMPQFANSYESNWMKNEALEMRVAEDETAWGFYTPTTNMMHFWNHDDPVLYPDVDWANETIRTGWAQKYNMDIAGGTKFVKYFAALSYINDGDILNTKDLGFGYDPTNRYQRFNFRTNLDFALTKTTDFRVDVSGYRGATQSPNLGGGWYVWDGLYGKAPDAYPIYYPDGVLGWDDINDVYGANTIAYLNHSGAKKGMKTDIITTLQLKQKLDFITKGLSLKAQFSYQVRYNSGSSINFGDVVYKYINPETGEERWTYPYSYQNEAHGFDFAPGIPRVNAEGAPNSVYRNTAYQVSLNYARKFKKHNVTALAVWKRRINAQGSSFASFREEWAGRVTYDFDGRYLFETNMAYNGSEAFGPGYKFGFFPSVAVGWVISNEKFIKDNLKWLNFWKIRYSCGKVGSDNGIPRWLYQSSWENKSPLNGQPHFGKGHTHHSLYETYSEGTIANPDAHWETAIKNNVGMELKLFESTLSFNVDYYWNNRKDIFMNASLRNIPPWFGAKPVAANLGMTKDHGVDLELKYSNDIGYNFRYFINLSASFSKNKIVKSEDPELMPSYQKKEGFPIGTQRDIINGGVMTSWDDVYLYPGALDNNSDILPGYYHQVDYNGDGYIDSNDVVPSGYGTNPEQMYTIAFGCSWKGLSVSANFYGLRNFNLRHYYLMWSNTAKMSISRPLLENSFIPSRPDASMNLPVAQVGQANNGDENLADGTLWRLKTAEIAYTFKGKALKKMGLSALRIYVNGDNLFLWNHLDMDRERAKLYAGEDRGAFGRYPMTRTVSAGLNLTF